MARPHSGDWSYRYWHFFFDSTEAVRLEPEQVEPEFFLNFTYILVQGPMGWRIAHIHASPAQEEHIQLPSTIHGFH